MKRFYLLSILALTTIALIYSCSTEEEDTSPPPSVVATPEPEPPAPTQYTLTVTAGEGGSVSTEGGSYDEGTEVTITATPEEGYVFVGWEGSDSESNSLSIILNGNTTLQALFAELEQFTLSIKLEEGGTVIAEEGQYYKGDLVTVIAAPNEGYGFVGWGGFIPPNTTSPMGSGEEFPNEKEELSFYIYDDIVLEPEFYWYYDIAKITLPTSNNSFLNKRPANIFKNLNLVSVVSRDYPGAVAVLDYNNDGNLDLIHCNSNYFASYEGILDIRKMEFYTSDNEGYLTLDQELSNKYDGLIHAYRAVVADYDNNGFMDVFFAATGFDDGSITGEKPLLLLNNGNGTFEFERFENYDINGYWHSGSASDFDNDGRIEIVIINPLQPNLIEERQTSKVIEIINNQVTVETLPLDFLYTNGKLAVEFNDLNNDGYLDMVVAGNDIIEDVTGWLNSESGYFDDNGDAIPFTEDDFKSSFVWYGSESGFNEKIELPLNSTFYKVLDIQFFDIDGDGDEDLVFGRTAAYQKAYYQIIRNNNNSFEDVTAQYIDNDFEIAGGGAAEILIGDFNNDGIFELLHNDYDRFRNQHVWEFRNNRFEKVNRLDY